VTKLDDLERIADPELLSAFKRFRILFGILLLAILFLAAIVAHQVVVNSNQNDRLARVEQGPCLKEPKSQACERYVRELFRAQSVGTSCIVFRNVGYPCPVGPVRPVASHPTRLEEAYIRESP
jgi:hypothetical protein